MGLNVLICDYSAANARNIAFEFMIDDGYSELNTLTDGSSALELIRKRSPDILITELLLPGLDGTELIYEAKKRGSRAIVALSCFDQPKLFARAIENGAGRCVIKPSPPSRTVCIAKELLSKKEDPPRNIVYESAGVRGGISRSEAMKRLDEAGMSRTLDGYQYMTEAIMLAGRDPVLLSKLTERLYPMVAANTASSAERVERSMRYAVEKTFERARVDDLFELFGFTADPERGKLTNGAFIAALVERSRISRLL